MLSVDNREYISPSIVRYDLSGTSDDTPPVGEYNGRTIANGSTYIDWNAGKLYRYDIVSQQWQPFGGGD